jgi:antitoxin MazE
LTPLARLCIFIVDTREVPMKTRVQKWGNSLALRIPKAFAAEARLREDTPVELSLVDGKLVIQPLALEPPTLDDLLRGITDQNLHGEWDTGPAVGREVW